MKAGAGKGTSFNKYLKGSDVACHLSPDFAVAFLPFGEDAPPPAFALCIDYLTFTADLGTACNAWFTPEQAESYVSFIGWGQCEEIWAAHVLKTLFGDAITIQPERRGFRHFYEHHFRIQTDAGECGFIAFGGARQRGTFCVQLTGAGCAHVEAWADLQAKLASASATITRVDVAYDDFLGAFPIGLASKLHRQGKFTTNGRPPAICRQGWNDGSGQTVYIGKNTGNQQLCVYEKGRQLGDPSSPWVRWEARFGSKYRVIPLEILTQPAAFVRGHYPCLSWFGEHANRMETHVKRAKAQLVRALHWMRHQYGATLNLIRQHLPDSAEFGRVLEHFTRPKLPEWAASVPHGYFSRAHAVQSLAAVPF